jgi:hypothetical protein
MYMVNDKSYCNPHESFKYTFDNRFVSLRVKPERMEIAYLGNWCICFCNCCAWLYHSFPPAAIFTLDTAIVSLGAQPITKFAN